MMVVPLLDMKRQSMSANSARYSISVQPRSTL
jgi:hypothetical protein